MPKLAQSLTDTRIKNIKPTDKAQTLFDGGGLYLEITTTGSKLWRMKYRFNGKAVLLALGAYPTVTLQEARERREEAKKLLANGVNPAEVKKAQKAAGKELAANNFEAIAREWFSREKESWVANHSDKIIKRLERDVFPFLGSRPVAEITAPEVLAVTRRVEATGAIETAHRIKSDISRVIRYAIATGRAQRDPVPDLRGALKPVKTNHFAAITEPLKVGELLMAMEGFTGTFVVRCALRLAPLFFVRPGELRQAEWKDINLDKAEWRFTVTKTKTEHLVPLARQAIAILKELHPLTGHGKYVFPSQRTPSRPMSENAVLYALRSMGIPKEEMTGHGFRAMARTILAEELHQKPEVIEHQLAHKVPDALGTAYNRTKFLKERKLMMQQWADYLDDLKAGGKDYPNS